MKQEGKTTIEEIVNKINLWESYWNKNNQIYADSNAFLNGNQWDNMTAAYYTESKKPMLTVNLLYLFLKQVVSEQIQNLPELEVVPKNMQVKPDMIELLENLLRTIMIYSNGEEALQTSAKQNMVAFSFIKVNTRYSDDDTFQQEIYFDVVQDPTLCGADPNAQNKNKDDGDYFYQKWFMSKEEWEHEYPGIPWQPGNFGGFASYFTNGYLMQQKDTCEVADFYIKEYYTKRLAKVAPGIGGKSFDVIEEKQFDQYMGQYLANIEEERELAQQQGRIYFTPALPKIVERRKERAYKIMCYRCRRDKILDCYEWPGKFLPMVYVPGDDFFIDGQQYVKSFTQEAHDLQKSINVIFSSIVQLIKTARNERTLATPTQMRGFEDIYRNPERSYGVLPFNPDPMNPGPPELVAPPAVPQELQAHLQWAVQTLGNILGRSESVMGINPNGIQSQPTSGKAYEKMVMQQNQSAYPQVNNLFMSVQKIGEICLDLIPRVYTDEQILTVYDRDYQHEQVPINYYDHESGEMKNEISFIKASVVLSPAPSFEMQKQVERDYILNLFQAGATNPQLFSLLGWKMAQLSETSITPEVVKVLKTLVPPNVLATLEGKPIPPPPPNPELMLQQQQLQLKQQELQNQAAKNQVDAVANMVNLQQSKIKADAEVQKAAFETEKQTASMRATAMKVTGDHIKTMANLFSQ